MTCPHDIFWDSKNYISPEMMHFVNPPWYFQYKSTITARPIKIYIHFIKIHHLKEYYYDNLTRFKGTLHAKHYKKENERNGQ